MSKFPHFASLGIFKFHILSYSFMLSSGVLYTWLYPFRHRRIVVASSYLCIWVCYASNFAWLFLFALICTCYVARGLLRCYLAWTVPGVMFGLVLVWSVVLYLYNIVFATAIWALFMSWVLNCPVHLSTRTECLRKVKRKTYFLLPFIYDVG